MKVAIYLLTLLHFTTALPSQRSSRSDIKGINLYVDPVSNYTVDEAVDGRIIGGDEIAPHTRAYQVALIINGQNFCSGSLISQNYVLTAAHCTATASYVELIFGAHNVNSYESTQLRVTSNSIISHPDYKNPYPLSNDIALIKTPTPIVTNGYINKTLLASSDSGPYEGYTPALSGWGTTSDSGTGISTGLRHVWVGVLKNTECAGIYGHTYDLTYNMCTSGAGPAGACNGDSGSPLVVGPHQIGLVSFISSRGCEYGDPTGYVRIGYYRPWIDQYTGGDL
ncbi:hypothetical protein NQ315_011575 [Exocentrus adspersus]|uniref:Peptidase S1 domain-containing protein n=1 Tax=Exocentrus adspersus TaxID=1586481 RepID=A0AAV8VUS2_9CUCU|nr:hypothetical protein NQ315_011575 [Exocentrus adspersus]